MSIELVLQYLSTLLQVMGGGVGVWAATEIVKGVKAIPINAGDVTKLRALAGGLSVGATLILGLVNNTLTPDDVQGVITAVLGAAISWGTAHVTHKAMTK